MFKFMHNLEMLLGRPLSRHFQGGWIWPRSREPLHILGLWYTSTESEHMGFSLLLFFPSIINIILSHGLWFPLAERHQLSLMSVRYRPQAVIETQSYEVGLSLCPTSTLFKDRGLIRFQRSLEPATCVVLPHPDTYLSRHWRVLSDSS